MISRYTSLVAVAALTGLPIAAQTLDQGNTAPVPDETFPMMSDAYTDPGPAGEGQIWDFSWLPTGFAYTETYREPDETDYGAFFPAANVVQDILQGWFYGFHQTDNGGMDFAGYVFTSPEEVVAFEEPERIVPFPCSFGSTWSGDLYSAYTNPNPVELTGDYTGEADGTGLLMMPYGTVDNVLRVRIIEQYTLNVDDSLAIVDHYVTKHLFLRPDVHRPVLMIYNELIISGTDTIVEQGVDWIANIALAEEEMIEKPIGIEIFPNPAADQASVVFSGAQGIQRLELIDATGRLMLDERLSAASGIQRHDLDVSALPAGLYQVRLTHANGQMGSKRLVVR